MKKIALIAVAAIVTILAGGPVIISGKVETAYNNILENMPDNAGVAFKTLEFNKGYTQSTATTVVTITHDRLPPELANLSLVMTSTIKHGPLMFTTDGIKWGMAFVDAGFTLDGLTAEQQAALKKLFHGDLANFHALIDFGLDIDGTFTLSSFKLEEGDAKVEFGGVTLSGTSDINVSDVSTSLTIHPITIQTPDLQASVVESSGELNMSSFNDDVMLGTADYNFPEVTVNSAFGEFTFKNIGVEFSALENQQGLIDVTESMYIRDMTLPYPITAASYNFELLNLDPAAISSWSKLSDQLRDLARQADANNEALNPEDVDPEMFRDALSATSKAGMEFNQFVTVDGFGGQAIADLDIHYVGLPNDLHPLDVKDPIAWLGAFKVGLLVEADSEAMAQTPAMPTLGELKTLGLITEEDGKLKLKAELKEGLLTINGQPIPQEALIKLSEAQASAREAEASSDEEASSEALPEIIETEEQTEVEASDLPAVE